MKAALRRFVPGGTGGRRARRWLGVALALGLAGAVALGSAPSVASLLTGIWAANGSRAASFVPLLGGERPIFILALGSDARKHEMPTRERSDSIHIVGIDRSRRRATILGFPRDAWVDIPGRGMERVNKALEYGGPELVVRTIERITGIPIGFWILTSFGGLVRMVDEVGGLVVRVPRPMHDPFSGANFSAGLHRFTGRQALAFARDRHDVPNGDFGRSANHGRLLVSALSSLRRTFDADPAELLRWMMVALRETRTNITVSQMLDLALTAARMRPAAVRNLVVPGRPGLAGAAAVVFISSAARSIYEDMRRDGVVDGP